MTGLRVAAAQLDVTVGDLRENGRRIREVLAQVDPSRVDLVAFPELAVTGYPPEDLLLKSSFVDDNLAVVDEIAREAGDVPAVVGFVDRVDGLLFNAAAVCRDRSVEAVYHKVRLPNYSVFDEDRYFTPGDGPPTVFDVGGVGVGVTICEDAWSSDGPIPRAVAGGAQVVVNINASPFHRGKQILREQMLADRVAESGVPVAYVNLIGGQDELVFDGGSMVTDAVGRVVARSPRFVESTDVLEVPLAAGATSGSPVAPEPGPREPDPREPDPREPDPREPDPREEVYQALVLGTRDYVRKNGFTQVVLGLSGGVDSALTALIAVDALGADNVHGVLMPSRYSSGHSVDDAVTLAEGLGFDHRTIAIEDGHRAFLSMLDPSFAGTDDGVAEENLQPRIRGTLLMALSNKFGWLVLTTGNKSEMAVGYATLYGDMAGGYAVIKDVPKLLVYDLCRWRNEQAGRDLIPHSVIDKPPSAELRPDQFDTDSLPPYEILDPLLERYIEGDLTAGDLVESGYDEAMTRRITGLVDRNEYKRRQAPPGPRITTKGFGKDRRLPVTNRYQG